MAKYLLLACFITTVADTFAYCPYRWLEFRHSCYLFSSSEKSWHDASDSYKYHSSELVSIESADEESFLKSVTMQFKDSFPIEKFWTSGTDMFIEGSWVWSSKSVPFSYLHWGRDKPNRYHGLMENCLEINQKLDYVWSDKNCKEVKHFICEKQLIETPVVKPQWATVPSKIYHSV